MTRITAERRSLKHEAIQALNLFNADGAGNMHGIKSVSRIPRWERNSWNGLEFTQFSISLSENALAQVQAYCAKYTDDEIN